MYLPHGRIIFKNDKEHVMYLNKKIIKKNKGLFDNIINKNNGLIISKYCKLGGQLTFKQTIQYLVLIFYEHEIHKFMLFVSNPSNT